MQDYGRLLFSFCHSCTRLRNARIIEHSDVCVLSERLVSCGYQHQRRRSTIAVAPVVVAVAIADASQLSVRDTLDCPEKRL